MLKDAVNCKPKLDSFVRSLTSHVVGARVITAPVKGLPRIMQKVAENCKYWSEGELLKIGRLSVLKA
jgi:hypothetical protein